jgi:4-amino-4-deoxy-L-arabinose transferase-like glycosyltransferase
MAVSADFTKYRYLILWVVAFALFSAFSGAYPLYILDEAKNSEAAREMLLTQNFWKPTFNEALRTDKPPLHYFFMMLSYSLFGVGPFAARFFSAVAGAFNVVVISRSTERYLNVKTSNLTALILTSALLFAHEFHMAVPDPYLIFFVTASLLCFFEFSQGDRQKSLWWGYGFLGLALLSKGPIAAVIVLLTAFVYLGWARKLSWRVIRTFQPLKGVIFALLIAAPWYYMAHISTDGAFTEGFFLDHNLNRFSDEKEGHGGPFIITPLLVIAGLLPFGIWLIPAVKHVYQRSTSNEFLRFCFSVAAVVVVFFSFSETKLPNYPMPSFAFLGVMLADYFYHLQLEDKRRPFLWGVWVLLVLGLFILLGAFFALKAHPALADIAYVSFVLAPLVLVPAGLLWRLRKWAYSKLILLLGLSWMLVAWMVWGLALPSMNTLSPVEKARPWVEQGSIVVYKRLDPAFLIQMQRTFTVVQSREALAQYVTDHSKGYILTNTKEPTELLWLSQTFELVLEAPALFEDHVTRLYRISK